MQASIEAKVAKSQTPIAEEWRRYDRMFGPLGRSMIEAVGLRAGEAVIDVGCGAGGSTLEASAIVGDSGHVVGIDIDPSAISIAKARAGTGGFRNVEFVVGDAARHSQRARRADAVISRFGNLFFSDAPSAHSHLAGALRSQGRLSCLVPRELERNPWAALPMRVVSRVLGKNTIATSLFLRSDPRWIVSILEKAGFERIRLESIDEPICLGADLDDAVDFFAKTEGRETFATASSPQTGQILQGLSRALAPYVRDRGVYLPASVWLVSARVR